MKGISTVRTVVVFALASALSAMPTMGWGLVANAQSSRAQRGIDAPRITLARAQVRREERKTRRAKERSSDREASSRRARKPEGPRPPLVAVVSLRNQTIRVYGPEGVIAKSSVSTGQAGHRTPAGIFSILQRNRHHESNIYSGAPMPYMQRLTWSGIALHQGHVPGYPASHGCIRLPGGFASALWGKGHVGMRVIVTPANVAPAPIAHAHLPMPVLTPIADASDRLPRAVRMASTADAALALDPTMLDPYKLAVVRRAKLLADEKATAAAVKAALNVVAERSAVADEASAALRVAATALAVAEEDVRAAQAARERVTDDESKAKVDSALAAAGVRLASAQVVHATARVEEHAQSDAAFEAVKAAKVATAAADAAKGAARKASALVEPVSVFISRKEGRVYVRQGFVPLHDEAIEIADRQTPIGTHVFTALDAADHGAQLSWSAISLTDSPKAATGDDNDDDRPRRRRKVNAPGNAKPAMASSTARQALDRITLPEATRNLIGDRLWPGASLIVSDHGVSGETGRGTDFVVLTR